MKVVRKEKMITSWRSSWLLNKFSLSTPQEMKNRTVWRICKLMLGCKGWRDLPDNLPTPIYTYGWRGALWKCLTLEHNALTRPALNCDLCDWSPTHQSLASKSPTSHRQASFLIALGNWLTLSCERCYDMRLLTTYSKSSTFGIKNPDPCLCFHQFLYYLHL